MCAVNSKERTPQPHKNEESPLLTERRLSWKRVGHPREANPTHLYSSLPTRIEARKTLTSSAQSYLTARTTSVSFCPPKPKLLDSAVRISQGLAWLGT